MIEPDPELERNKSNPPRKQMGFKLFNCAKQVRKTVKKTENLNFEAECPSIDIRYPRSDKGFLKFSDQKNRPDFVKLCNVKFHEGKLNPPTSNTLKSGIVDFAKCLSRDNKIGIGHKKTKNGMGRKLINQSSNLKNIHKSKHTTSNKYVETS